MINTDTQAVELLKDRGWFQWYNPDYWCHEQFAINGIDPTKRGMSTSEAYSFETDSDSREKILKGMELFNAAERALSNLGSKNHDQI